MVSPFEKSRTEVPGDHNQHVPGGSEEMIRAECPQHVKTQKSVGD